MKGENDGGMRKKKKVLKKEKKVRLCGEIYVHVVG